MVDEAEDQDFETFLRWQARRANQGKETQRDIVFAMNLVLTTRRSQSWVRGSCEHGLSLSVVRGILRHARKVEETEVVRWTVLKGLSKGPKVSNRHGC